jgi:hypothetical protein
MNPPAEGASLSLEVLGQRVHVACADAAASAVLRANFGAMIAASGPGGHDFRYRIERGPQSSFTLARDAAEPRACADLGDLAFALEKDLTIELQLRRRELFFLHAAALEWQGRAVLVAGASGNGKSTTAWALLHRGFRFLSDELAPLELDTMTVHAFPHALCLKHDPPPPYALPDDAIRLGPRVHVPPHALPGSAATGPHGLAAVFLVAYRPGLAAPQLREIGRAEAGARLYVCALNPLAHVNEGLDAAVRIAERTPCFAVDAAELARTAALIGATAAATLDRRVTAA